MAQTPNGSGNDNFLGAGLRELRRRFERGTLRRELRRHGEQRDAALAALGEKAWAEKIDLTPFGDLGSRLHGVAARAGELATTAQQLEERKSVVETERRNELEKFEARRREVEDRKRPVDASLNAARERLATCERVLTQARARLAALAAELATATRELETPGTAADPESAAKAAAARERQARVRAEQDTTGAALTAAEAELPGLAAEVGRQQAEADRHAGAIAAIDAEQKAVLGRIDHDLNRVRTELQTATQQQHAVGRERTGLFRELGQAVYATVPGAPALHEPIQHVAAIEQARAATESQMHASLFATQALPAGTMPKFWGVLIGVPLLVGALAAGSYVLVKRYVLTPAPVTFNITVTAPAKIDPETEKDQAVHRFLQAGKTTDEQTHRAAVQILQDDILTMGASADPAHLPTLAKILRSAEPGLRAAAADAIGMIRPTAAETGALAQLLQDPMPPVVAAARRALAASADPAARELAARAGATE